MRPTYPRAPGVPGKYWNLRVTQRSNGIPNAGEASLLEQHHWNLEPHRLPGREPKKNLQ
jgi:hypothetical protein